MFKLQIDSRIYYFVNEMHYDAANDYLKDRNPIGIMKILHIADICIDVSTNSIVKNRNMSIVDFVESKLEIETPRKQIDIVIHGRCGSGKTRIAALINKLLYEHGFMTRMEFKEELPASVYETLPEAIEAIKPRIKIKITEKTINRARPDIL